MAAVRVGADGAPTPSYAYLFEAKGVQRWLFDSGPLRDLIGASDLVAGLTASDGDGLLSDVLAAVGLNPNARFSRRAGGAFCVHWSDRRELERFRALWRLAVALNCPGLECSDAGPVEARDEKDGVEQARKASGGIRFNSAANLPPTGHPFTLFNPRTGRLATRVFAYGGDQTLVDVVSEPHREHADALARTFARSRRHDRVARRFLTDAALEADPPYVFPRNLEPDEGDEYDNPLFPFRAEDRRIVVLHADLSGLGQIFHNATKSARSAGDIKEVADAIERVVEGAAQNAMSTLLIAAEPPRDYDGKRLRVLPARPVLLGGDDITILIRPDLAFRFAETLLKEIEARSEREFEAFANRGLGLKKVSACAGLAVVKAGQPFLMANTLAETLVKHAKKRAKARGAPPYPSFLAFHVSQSTLREEYEMIVNRELTARGVSLTANPYRVGSPPEDGECGWDDLTKLAKALAEAPQGRGKLIEAGRHLFDEPAEAQRKWTRWREVLERETDCQRDDIDVALRSFDRGAEPTLTASIGAISDALELIDLGAIDAESQK
jgi:hypothetical protein